MDNFINNFLLLVALCLLFFVFFFTSLISRYKRKNFIYYLPLIVVIVLFISIYAISHYYEKKYAETVSKYEYIVSKKASDEIDSVSSRIDSKVKVLDSLKKIDSELSVIIKNIETQERILGDRKKTINDIINSKTKTQELISKIKNYNDILEESDIPKHSGYIQRSDTPNFTLYPPTDREEDYIDFGLIFNNENIVSKIKCLYIVVYRNENGKTIQQFAQYYAPQKGVNMFRVKNYLKDRNTHIYIGYFTNKSFENNEYPVYECIKVN